MSRLRTAFSFALVVSACGSLDPAGGGGGQGGAGGTAGVGGGSAAAGPVASLSVLESTEDYAAVSGEGAEVKYLAIVDGAEPPSVFRGAECLFQNTTAYPYHLFFLRTFPEYAELSAERYTDLVLRRASRVMWGGGLKLLPGAPHPRTGTPG
ncbi:MAG TPA: hypothetical protein VGK73_35670, partial [Polyangiaceae bacterium]